MGKAFKARVRYRHRLRAPTFGETCGECGGDVKIIASSEGLKTALTVADP